MKSFPQRLIEFVRGPLGQTGRVGLHEPIFGGNEWVYVKECLDTGWVSSVGAYVDRFERDFAAYVGSAHAVVTVNGTAALHLALVAVGVRADDLVIAPTLTFVATLNAISHCGAKPLLLDADPQTLGLDAAALRAFLAQTTPDPDGPRHQGRRVAACVPVHIFGHATDIEETARLCAEYGVPLVEDATEALGASVGARALGRFGAVGVFSFNGNKIITTGGGGMVVTDDEALALRLKHLSTTARVRDRWNFVHDEVGWNYRLPNVNAAIGCAQLEQLPAMLLAKRALAERYRAAFADCAQASFWSERQGARGNYWLNAFLLADRDARDAALEAANAAGVETRPVWTLMHELAPYRAAPRFGAMTGATHIADRLINVPSSAALGGFTPQTAAAQGAP